MNDETKARLLKEEAEKIALELIEHAKETARQMILTTNLDTSKIPLICNKIIKIQSDLVWIKYIVLGTMTGIGGLIIGVAYLLLQAHIK